MRLFLVLLIIILHTSYAQQPIAKYVKLSGRISNAREVVHIKSFDEISFIQDNTIKHSLQLDSIGNFETLLLIDKPTYFQIGFNELYLEPADSVHLMIDISFPERSSFSGTSAQKQEYLKSVPWQKSGSYLKGGTNIKSTYEKTIAHVLMLADNQEKRLLDISNASTEFIELEKARIQSDIINTLANLPNYYNHIYRDYKLNKDSLQNRNKVLIEPLIKKYTYNFANKKHLPSHAYRHIIYYLMKDSISANSDEAAILEWYNASNISEMITADLDIKNANKVDSIIGQINNISRLEYKKALLDRLNKLQENNIKSIAKNFSYTNTNGNSISLDSHKGKVIYIDFWATWCMPCLEEKPAFKMLKKQFNNDVVFLSISIDHNFPQWQKHIETSSSHPEIIEGWINKDNIPSYAIMTIPRYILIDKDLKIADFAAPKPHSKAIIEKIGELLGTELL